MSKLFIYVNYIIPGILKSILNASEISPISVKSLKLPSVDSLTFNLNNWFLRNSNFKDEVELVSYEMWNARG